MSVCGVVSNVWEPSFFVPTVRVFADVAVTGPTRRPREPITTPKDAACFCSSLTWSFVRLCSILKPTPSPISPPTMMPTAATTAIARVGPLRTHSSAEVLIDMVSPRARP
jgi:hypothetical protein